MAEEEEVSPTADLAFMWQAQSFFRYDGPHRIESPKFKTVGFAEIPMIEVVVWVPKGQNVGNILPVTRQAVVNYVSSIPDALEYVHFRPRVSSGARRRKFIDQNGVSRFGIRHEVYFEVDPPLAKHLRAIQQGTVSGMDIERLGLMRRHPEVHVRSYRRRR